jgi:hypothetical protein
MKQHGKLLWTDAQNSKSPKRSAGIFNWIEDTYIEGILPVQVWVSSNYVGLENGSFPQGLLFFGCQYKVVYCCIETQSNKWFYSNSLHSLIKS